MALQCCGPYRKSQSLHTDQGFSDAQAIPLHGLNSPEEVSIPPYRSGLFRRIGGRPVGNRDRREGLNLSIPIRAFPTMKPETRGRIADCGLSQSLHTDQGFSDADWDDLEPR